MGKEWTAADIGTIITAVVDEEKSKGEQTDKSHRGLGGKAAKARLGEWQGRPVRLGLDVVCFSLETGKELWQVVFEGVDQHAALERLRHWEKKREADPIAKRPLVPLKRLKVYPDGRTERFDGERIFPQSQPLTEVLRVAPSRDKAKIDAAAIEAELKPLREEHDRLVVKWGDLPTQRAKATAAACLAALDQRMEELERQREDAADVVEWHYREMLDLQRAIAEAKIATRSEAGERALRRRAEALRSVIHRIECTFTATGHSGGDPGKSNSRLTKVTIYPVCGEAASYGTEDQNVIPRTSVVSRW